MKEYYRLMLGGGSKHAAECLAGSFVGANFAILQDLTGRLSEEWRDFNREFIPIFQAAVPGKSKIAAGLACGALWTVSKGLQRGDILLCPDESGRYHIAEVAGDYQYQPGADLPHRRPVRWLDKVIDRKDMSDALRGSASARGTVSCITKHAEEIERLIGGIVITPDPIDVEELAEFAMEKHLEDFLVANWAQTELGKDFQIFEEEGDKVGQQYQTDTGPIDILAVSKDKKKLLVVELKRGRASDAVTGQVLRYMGYVKEELAEEGQTVEGAVIALRDDPKLKRAISMVPSIRFYRYEINFRLVKT